jgi:acetyl-CoA C-acetyltransferase
VPEAYIVGAVRTPIGTRKGALAGLHPADLAAHVLRELVTRTGVDPAAIDDVIMGCVNACSGRVHRADRLALGWPAGERPRGDY